MNKVKKLETGNMIISIIKEYHRFKAIESNQYNIEWNVKRILSKANYHIHTDAVKNYILHQKKHTINTEWLSYAEEANREIRSTS